MATGVKIYNDTNVLQITETTANFVLHSKGSVNLDGSTWATGYSMQCGSHAQISIPNTYGFPPILALRCDVEIVVFRMQLVGGNWVYDIVAEASFSRTNTVYWWAYGPCPNTKPSTYGLAVYKADGTLAYHSGYLPLRILQKISAAGNYTATAGKTIAFAVVTAAYSWTPQIPAGTYQQRVSGTSLKLTAANTGVIGMTNYGVNQQSQNFGWQGGSGGVVNVLMIDVTNQ